MITADAARLYLNGWKVQPVPNRSKPRQRRLFSHLRSLCCLLFNPFPAFGRQSRATTTTRTSQTLVCVGPVLINAPSGSKK